MPDYAIFKVHVALLTPLHIGNGVNLLKDYDYAVYGNRTWRLNDAALLDLQPIEDDMALVSRLALTPPAHLLEGRDYQPENSIFRYVIDGAPRAMGEGAQIQEQLKDIHDQLYLPGTSLKGALRTAIAWYAWGQLGLKPNVDQLWQSVRHYGDRPRLVDRRYASQPLERDLFVQKDAQGSKETGYELLKALQVSDSAALDAGHLMLLNVSVLNRDGSLGTPVELEAIHPAASFELTLKLDLALFSQWAQRGGLKLKGLEWLTHLPEVIQVYTCQRLQEEIAWYSQVSQAKQVLAFYQELASLPIEVNSCLLQLGWGIGWDGKTLGSRLRVNPDFMRVLLDERRGRGYGLARFRIRHPQAFPGSRRVVINLDEGRAPSTGTGGGEALNIPCQPLGWVKLTFSPDQAALDWASRVTLPVLKEALLPKTPLLGVDRKEEKPSGKPHPTHPIQPGIPKGLPPTPRQPEHTIIASFSTLPRRGDRFMGIIFEVSNDILLEIPGLDPDDLAYAVIQNTDWPALRRFHEGDEVLCRVVNLKEEYKGYWRVRCQVE